MTLRDNKITSIEPDSFTDLIRLKGLDLAKNMIKTFDEKLFVSMVKLQKLLLNQNKIKSLSPNIFKIPANGELRWVDLKNNECINGIYDKSSNLHTLEVVIKANCTQ